MTVVRNAIFFPCEGCNHVMLICYTNLIFEMLFLVLGVKTCLDYPKINQSRLLRPRKFFFLSSAGVYVFAPGLAFCATAAVEIFCFPSEMRHSNSYKVEHYLKKSNDNKSHLSPPGESELTKGQKRAFHSRNELWLWHERFKVILTSVK